MLLKNIRYIQTNAQRARCKTRRNRALLSLCICRGDVHVMPKTGAKQLNKGPHKNITGPAAGDTDRLYTVYHKVMTQPTA